MSTNFNGTNVDIERDEVNWLLTSGVLGRSHNLSKMLKFICEKHFEGKADQITEYSVAVEALGRRSDFDPQADTIVRVTAHLLRKRLQDIYQEKGTARRVHVLIPAGQYAPSFVHLPQKATEDSQFGVTGEPAHGIPTTWAEILRHKWLIPVLLLAIIVLAGVTWLLMSHRQVRPAKAASSIGTTSGIASDSVVSKAVSGSSVHALLGNGRKAYVDHSGFTWLPGNYCSGGSSISEPNQKIMGTQDPAIFLGGVRGNTHCSFPVDRGIYEVHLLFAEASDLQVAVRPAVFFLNESEGNTLDVVDDAGGDGIATIKVFRGVRPEIDGAIHIDFSSEISALKAVEILPTATEAALPVRIVASPSSYKDSVGNIWLSDRYFIGGRFGRNPNANKNSLPGIYKSSRIGRFRYILPVIPREKYQVKLYFQESWFGQQNGGTGGSHGRVFDVWCNGASLLHNFNLLNEAGSVPLVKTFDHIQATAQGKIELDFVPVANYPIINAIEVLPEP